MQHEKDERRRMRGEKEEEEDSILMMEKKFGCGLFVAQERNPKRLLPTQATFGFTGVRPNDLLNTRVCLVSLPAFHSFKWPVSK